MSWLDDDAYANDREHLRERLLQKRVVLVAHKLSQGVQTILEPRLDEHFEGTALARGDEVPPGGGGDAYALRGGCRPELPPLVDPIVGATERTSLHDARAPSGRLPRKP